MNWKKKITKKEFKHIVETTDNGTLREFKVNREFHKKDRERDGKEPCLECRFIAKKLGLEN